MKRDNDYATLYAAAAAAGKAAGDAAVPIPMIVGSPSTPFGNDVDPTKKTYYVEGGVCGFAWVSVKPGNSPFANWLKRNGYGRKDSYAGGVSVSVSDYGQSMTRKSAYARAFSAVLNAAGIRAYAQDRID